jgi:hypothetical protein
MDGSNEAKLDRRSSWGNAIPSAVYEGDREDQEVKGEGAEKGVVKVVLVGVSVCKVSKSMHSKRTKGEGIATFRIGREKKTKLKLGKKTMMALTPSPGI